MLKLKTKRFDRRNNTPILSNNEIDEFAHAVLADYKPELIKEPGMIRFEHFLEVYLGANLFYEDIYHEDPQKPIFGATAFQDTVLKVFDKEKLGVKHINVPAHSVIIDNYVMQEGKEGLATFTGLHEGGHILLHSQVCAEDRGNEWQEYQADYFAAAIAMPNATFRPFASRLLREHGIRRGRIYLGADEDLDILAKDILPDFIKEVYGVSRQAAFIKLRKTGFIAYE